MYEDFGHSIHHCGDHVFGMQNVLGEGREAFYVSSLVKVSYKNLLRIGLSAVIIEIRYTNPLVIHTT